MEFKSPALLARHVNRKNPCRPVAGARIEGALAAAPQGLKKEVWKARDIMRRGGVTGLESLDCLLTVLFLREFEKLHPDVADPGTFPEFGTLPPECRALLSENKVQTYSKMAATPEHDGNKRDWSVVVRTAFMLCQKHSSANGVLDKFEAGHLFTLRDSQCAYALLQTCSGIDFGVTDDAFGSAYQSVIKDFLDGKELGQFFTPKCATQYLSKAAKEDRESLGIACDPTCGSGGFLVAAQLTKADRAVGYEIDNRVRLVASLQTLLVETSSGCPGYALQCDSLRDRNDQGEAFDTVLANPPFGVKGVKHEDLLATLGGQACYPFKTSATGFFLQKIVHILKVGGRACVVLPLGKELASRAASEARFRRALLRSLNIREIVAIPSNAFDNTGIRTVGLVFDKVGPLGRDIDLKGKKTAELSSPFVTEKILLRRLRTAEDGKTVLPESEPIPNTLEEVTLADLERAAWSLSPDDYRVGGGIGGPAMGAAGSVYPMVPLGELCEFVSGRYKSGDKNETGAYPFYTATVTNPTGRSDLNPFDFPAYILFAKQGGNSTDQTSNVGLAKAWLLRQPACASCHMLAMHAFDEKVSPEYLAAWINQNGANVRTETARFCTGLGSINNERLSALEIPLPPLEAQQAIAAELDAQAAALAGLEKAAEAVEKAKKVALENALYARGHLRGVSGSGELAEGVRRVPLGELCEFKAGVNITADALTGQGYPVVGGGVKPMGYHEVHNRPTGITLVSKDGAGVGHVSRYPTPVFLTGHGYSVHWGELTLAEYGYHYLKIALEASMNDMRRGAAQPALDLLKVLALVIPLPPPEVQQAIALELDALDWTAKGLKAAAAAAKETMRVTLAKALAPGTPLPGPAEADKGPEEADETEDAGVSVGVSDP